MLYAQPSCQRALQLHVRYGRQELRDRLQFSVSKQFKSFVQRLWCAVSSHG